MLMISNFNLNHFPIMLTSHRIFLILCQSCLSTKWSAMLISPTPFLTLVDEEELTLWFCIHFLYAKKFEWIFRMKRSEKDRTWLDCVNIDCGETIRNPSIWLYYSSYKNGIMLWSSTDYLLIHCDTCGIKTFIPFSLD